jgi:hypothetical protein
MIKALEGCIGFGADRACGETGPGFYTGDNISLFMEFYAAKGDFITTIAESVSFCLLCILRGFCPRRRIEHSLYRILSWSHDGYSFLWLRSYSFSAYSIVFPLACQA